MSRGLRIAAWNCCAGPLATKLAAARRLRADILVLPEAPRVPEDGQAAWIGENPRRGLAVLARAPWRVERIALPRVELPRYFLPVRIEGPETFTLWGVWAHAFGADRYVRATHRALDACRAHLVREQPLLLGDFNSHSRWDHQHPPGKSHSALVQRLAALGYVSAYHHARGQAHGREGHATFYEYRHRDKPYHLDYAFVPAWLAPRLRRVSVGRHGTWTRWSDHMPLVLELAAAGTGVQLRGADRRP